MSKVGCVRAEGLKKVAPESYKIGVQTSVSVDEYSYSHSSELSASLEVFPIGSDIKGVSLGGIFAVANPPLTDSIKVYGSGENVFFDMLSDSSALDFNFWLLWVCT